MDYTAAEDMNAELSSCFFQDKISFLNISPNSHSTTMHTSEEKYT